jgi:hypothetical protein
MQTIQIMILLLDCVIKLAPWRIVTGPDRLSSGRSLHAQPRLGGPGVIPPHVSRGGLVFSYTASVLYAGVALWAGVFWRRNERAGAEAQPRSS